MDEKERLVLNTKKSLYDPIEIEIDGQLYQTKKITHSVSEEINKLDKEVDTTGRNIEPIYKAVQFLFDLDRKILEKLDKREVQDIYVFVKKKFLEIEKERIKLISSTFEGIWTPDRKKPTGKIPSQKRPGNKP